MTNAQMIALEARQQRQEDFQRMKEWREEDRRQIEKTQNQSLRITWLICILTSIVTLIGSVLSGPIMDWLKAWFSK